MKHLFITTFAAAVMLLGSPVLAQNQPPTVSITSPKDGRYFSAPSDVEITLDAADADGSITHVLYERKVPEASDWVALGTAATANAPFTWEGVSEGVYEIRATVTDNRGAKGVSAPIQITLTTGNLPPVVVSTSPTAGDLVPVPGKFTFTVVAYDPDGEIKSITVNGGKFVPAHGPTYWTENDEGQSVLTDTRWKTGYYPEPTSTTFTIDVEDNQGKVTTVKVDFNIGDQPMVSLTSPVDGSFFKEQELIKISAETPNNVGIDDTLIRVEFYSDGKLIDSDKQRPFDFFYKYSESGDYEITARSIYENDKILNSEPIRIKIYPVSSFPNIEIQPEPTSTIQGTSVTFSVKAVGDQPLSYQWIFNGKKLGSKSDSPNLLLENLQSYQSGTYQVIVSNALGEITSDSVKLSVGVPPSFIPLGHPLGQTVIVGATVTFIGQANPWSLSYQWYKNGNAIEGATKWVLQLNNVTKENAGTYSVEVKNNFGKAVSDNAELVVMASSITLNPQDKEVLQYENVKFEVQVAGKGPFSYQWKHNENNIGDTTENPFLIIENVQQENSGEYKVSVINQYGVTESKPFQLIVKPLATNFIINNVEVKNTEIVATGSAVISVYSDIQSGEIFYTLDGTQPTFTSSAYLKPFVLTETAIIRAIAYSADFTRSAESKPVEVTIIPVYTMRVDHAGGGTVTIDPPSGPYPEGTEVNLTATPQGDWDFIGWSGDSTSSEETITITMNEAKALTPIFGTNITVNEIGAGKVIQTPSNPVPYGITVTFTAKPDTGHYLFRWAGEQKGNDNPTQLQITKPNPVVSGLFVLSPVPEISWSEPETITYGERLSEVHLSPSTEVEGRFEISHSKGDLLPAGEHVLQVDFYPTDQAMYRAVSLQRTIKVNKAPLTVSVENVTRLDKQENPAFVISYQGFVNDETKADLTSEAAASTTATAGSEAGKYPIILSGAESGNYEITFEEGVLTVVGKLKLTLQVPNSGKVNLTPNKELFDAGEKVKLEAIPSKGYAFTAWEGSVSSSDNPLEITINEDTTIKAKFAKLVKYTGVVVEGKGAIVIKPDLDLYPAYSRIEVLAVPAKNYEFVKWTMKGFLLSKNNPLTTSKVLGSDMEIEAHFKYVKPPEPVEVKVLNIVNAPFGFSFNTEEGTSYEVQSSQDLRSWGTRKPYDGTGTLIRFEDERDQVFPQIYYRVRVVE